MCVRVCLSACKGQLLGGAVNGGGWHGQGERGRKKAWCLQRLYKILCTQYIQLSPFLILPTIMQN